MKAAFLAGVLAVLRTRLAGAVLMPAVLAGSFALSRHALRPWRFLWVALGLLAAEFADLLIADLFSMTKGKKPELPGSPVWPALLRSPARVGAAFSILGAIGAVAFAVLFAQIGPGLLIPAGIAAICALLYAFQPFAGAFLATSLVPILITGGAYFAMSGAWSAAAFLAGAPISLVSVGVILTYKVAYSDGRVIASGKNAVIVSYLSAILAVGVLVASGVYRWPALFSMAPGAAGIFLAARLFRREERDYTPATAAGVLLHTVLSLSLAALIPL
jgi:hypothetical protein